MGKPVTSHFYLSYCILTAKVVVFHILLLLVGSFLLKLVFIVQTDIMSQMRLKSVLCGDLYGIDFVKFQGFFHCSLHIHLRFDEYSLG